MFIVKKIPVLCKFFSESLLPSFIKSIGQRLSQIMPFFSLKCLQPLVYSPEGKSITVLPFSEFHFGPPQSGVLLMLHSLCIKLEQQGFCHPFQTWRHFSLSLNMSLLFIGSRTELMIYCYGKFAYAKIYAKSKLGIRLYGPSSKSHKIRV